MPRRSAASPFGFALFAATGLLLAAAALAAEVQPEAKPGAKAASASRSLLQTAPAMPPPLPAQRSVAPASQPPAPSDDEGDDEPAQRAAAPASQPPALSDGPAERVAAPPADLLQLRDPGEFTPKDYRGFKNGLCCENFSGNENACKVSRTTTAASTSRRAARARGTDTHTFPGVEAQVPVAEGLGQVPRGQQE